MWPELPTNVKLISAYPCSLSVFSVLLQLEHVALELLGHHYVRGTILEATARELADRVINAVPVTIATVALWDQPEPSLTIHGVSAPRAVEGQRPVGSRVPLAWAHWYERVFLEHQAVVLHSESSTGTMSGEEAALALAPNLQSIYLVPIMFAGEPVGILALGEMRAPKRDPLDEHKQRRCRDVLDEFMAASASAWEARRLDGKLRAANALLRIAPRVIGARSYGEVLSTWSSRLAQWPGPPARGVLYGLDQRGGAAVVGRWPDPDGLTAEDEGQILAAVARRSEEDRWPLVPVDVVDDPLDPLHASIQAGAPLVRLDLPLQWSDELLGVACLYFREAFYPTTWQLEHLGYWGQIGALGMRLVSASHARGVEEQWLRQAASDFLRIHQPRVL